jgi:GTPase SAR1 family protein
MKFTKGTFNTSTTTTIGVEFSAKVVEIDNKKIRVQVWDTAG